MELRHYFKLIDEFERTKGDEGKKLRALLSQVIDLMGIRDEKVLENVLIIFLALVNEGEPDHLTSRGRSSATISPLEKKEFVSTLMNELSVK